MKRLLIGATGLALALAPMACSESFDRDAEIEEFVDRGMTEEQAECVVDGMIDEFGEDTLNSDRDPTAEEIERMTALTAECFTGDLGELLEGVDEDLEGLGEDLDAELEGLSEDLDELTED